MYNYIKKSFKRNLSIKTKHNYNVNLKGFKIKS